MQTITKIAFLLLLILGVGSCKLDDLQDIVVVADVEDEFNLDLWEGLSPEARTLQLQISTIKQEDCKNARIDHRFVKSGNGLSVSLLEIIQPSDCDPGLEPARANVQAGVLKGGFYSLSIDLKNTVFNEGQLSVLNDRYLIKMDSEDGIKLVRKELFRVPQNTIWGYVHFTDPGDEGSAQQFLNSVAELGTAQTIKIGYYGHFTVGASGNIESVHQQPAEGMVRPFLYFYQGGGKNLKDLLEQYRKDYGSRLTFRLFDDQGHVY